MLLCEWRKEKLPNLRTISINGLTIKPIKEGDNYKCPAIDENISCNERFTKEIKIHQTICQSYKKSGIIRLLDFNKALVYNAFGVPPLTSAVGILDWNCEEIHNINIIKTLAMSGRLIG